MQRRIARIGIWLALLAVPCAVLCPAQEGSSKSVRPKGIYPTAHGILKSISGSQFVLEVEEEHELKFHMTRKTKIFSQGKEVKPSLLEPGQTLDIDMQAGLDGSFDAVRIDIAPPNPGLAK